VIGAHLVLLFLPLLYSRDVYSYAMYGRIAAVYDENPYLRTPVDFEGDPLLELVGEKWLDTPPVYGPAFVSFSSLVARVAEEPVDHVRIYRLMAIAASLATIAVIVPTVRRFRPGWEAAALVAFGANPVILFHSVASGHNDLLVALAIVGAFALVLRGRELEAVAVLTVGALVKATAGLPLLLLLVWCVARRHPRARLRAFGVRAGVVAALGLFFAAPYWQTRDPTLGLFELAGHTGWLAPSVFLSRLIEVASFNTLGWLLRVVFALTLLVSVVVVAREVWRRAPSMPPVELAASWAWALVLLMALGPVLLPWYVAWSLPLVWLLPREPRAALLVTSVALGVSLWSTEPERSQTAFEINLWIGHWIITPVVSVFVLRTLASLRRRVREGLSLADLTSPPAERERVAAGAGERRGE
jgi:alpha-1,6-mannosyltransferase